MGWSLKKFIFNYHKNSNIRRTKSQKLKCLSSRFAVSVQSIEVRCLVENEDVVGGDAPTTSEWSIILLPIKVHLILEVWWYTFMNGVICVKCYCTVREGFIDDESAFRVPFHYKDHLFRDRIAIIKIRQSWDRLTFIMWISCQNSIFIQKWPLGLLWAQGLGSWATEKSVGPMGNFTREPSAPSEIRALEPSRIDMLKILGPWQNCLL